MLVERFSGPLREIRRENRRLTMATYWEEY